MTASGRVWGGGINQSRNKTVNNNYQNVEQRERERKKCIIDSSINVSNGVGREKERESAGRGGAGKAPRRSLVWSVVWLIFNFIRTVGCRPFID